jgi:hypothetical protein
MSTDSFARLLVKLAWLRTTAVLTLACLGFAACDAGQPTSPTVPRPTPTPTVPPQVVTTVPFGLTESGTFDIVGWDSWPAAPVPSGIKFRWNASISRYEVLPPGYDDWNRLEARTPYEYDVFASNGTKLPFYMPLWVPPSLPPAGGYVGNARIFEGSSARAYFAFGIATDPIDVPINGTMTCSFGEDEIGEGALTFDLARGTLFGSVSPFWASVQHQLVQTSFARGATMFAATFGSGGVLEGRFFGPGAVNIAVRAKGGGAGFTAVTGIMSGACSR